MGTQAVAIFKYRRTALVEIDMQDSLILYMDNAGF